MLRLWYLLPVAVFVPLMAGLGFSLSHDPRVLPSTLIDRPTPAFNLASLDGRNEGLSSSELKGRLTLLNVFASWCPGCRVEHPMLLRLAQSQAIPIYGLSWKDRQIDGQRWLGAHQNPYIRVGLDESGRTGIDLGVTGVPETFVIDRTGRIRYRYPGPLTDEVWREQFEPLLQTLRSEQ
jgi:cytochrome c biogenesis protein CcmG, thiol:disulfide interchange protein DsbE